MFDGEMVKKNFPFERHFGLRKFLVQDKVGQGPRQSPRQGSRQGPRLSPRQGPRLSPR